MEALESLCRAVGYGGWGAVLLGVLCVMMAVLLGGRRECVRVTVPVGNERRQIRHSGLYTPPRHRKDYRSSQRRL